MPGILDPSVVITINGIACSDEGTKEHFDIFGNNYVTRILRCAWSDRISLRSFLLGGSQVVGGVTIVHAGQPHPDYADLFASEIDIDGDGKKSNSGTNVVTYDRAMVTVTYRYLQYGSGSVTRSLSVDFSSQIISLPRSQPMLKFSDGAGEDLPPEDNPGLRVNTTTFEVTRYNLTSIPVAAILAAEASPVSSSAFMGAPAGKILFNGARSLERTIALGGTNIDLTIQCIHNPLGWNYVLDKTGAVRQVVRKNGDPLYFSSDLNNLVA